jgi:hypothetical protein
LRKPEQAEAASGLSDGEGAAERGLRYFDAHGEALAQVFEMRDDQDLLELRLDCLNCLDDAVAAVLVL